MSDPIAIDFEFTTEQVFRAKMLNFRRRSLPRYLACAALIAAGIFVSTRRLEAALLVFVMAVFAFSVVALSAIGVSSELLVRRRQRAGATRVQVAFSELGIDVVEGAKVERKEWSWIVQVIRSADTLALRTRDGAFRQTYLFVPKSSAYYAPLDALLSRRVGR